MAPFFIHRSQNGSSSLECCHAGGVQDPGIVMGGEEERLPRTSRKDWGRRYSFLSWLFSGLSHLFGFSTGTVFSLPDCYSFPLGRAVCEIYLSVVYYTSIIPNIFYFYGIRGFLTFEKRENLGKEER